MHIRNHRRGVTPPQLSESLSVTTCRETKQPPIPMRHSSTVDVDGVFLGVAVEHELGVRFIAIHARVKDMDQSIWPTVQYAQRSAKQLFKAGSANAVRSAGYP